MSQPELELYIQPPMFATSVAVQMTEKVLCRNGLQGEPTRLAESSSSMGSLDVHRALLFGADARAKPHYTR